MGCSTPATIVGAMACRNPAAFKFLAPQGNSSASGKGALTSVHSLSLYTASENHTAQPEEAFLVSKELKSFELKLSLGDPEIGRTVSG